MTPAKSDETAVAVKPLEWWPESALGFHRATTPFGEYVVMPDLNRHFNEVRWWFGAQREEGNSAPSVDAAKLAIQADFEARIRSALAPTKQEEPVALSGEVINKLVGAADALDLAARSWENSPVDTIQDEIDLAVKVMRDAVVFAHTSPSVSRDAIRAEAFEEAARVAAAFAKDDGVDPASVFGAGGREFARQIIFAIGVLKDRNTIYREMADAAAPEHGEGTL